MTMQRLRFVSVVCCVVLGASKIEADPVYAANGRPNIIVVFTDDQRYDAIGYAGNDVIQTPTLDRLARDGVIFDQCFVNTSICAVNRANIMVGQYPRRHGIDDFYKIFTESQFDRTYPALLKRNGYWTGFVGKWGMGNDVEPTYKAIRLFDFWAGGSHQTNYWHETDCPYVLNNGPNNVCTCGPDARGVYGPEQRHGKGGIEEPIHLTTEVFPRKVEEFLQSRDESKPFCLSLFFKAPHGPFTGWDDQRFADLFEGQEMPIPVTTTIALERAKPAFLRDNNTALGADTGRKWVEDISLLHEHLRHYYRLIVGIDFAMGKVAESLEQHGVDDNTVILFTSDNGHFCGEHGMSGKWLMREPSIHVPGFVYDPRLPDERRGQHLSEQITTIDFTASVLELAGVESPDDIQGRSFIPLVRGENLSRPWRTEWFYEHPYEHRGQIPFTIGVRTERFKYTRYISQDPAYEELFDLTKDPGETVNLVDDANSREQLDELRKKTGEYSESLR